MLLEETPISFNDDEEIFISPCIDLLAKRAAVAREIIWLVVRGEVSVAAREQREIGLELGRALRRQAAIKARILRRGCLVDPDAPF